MRDFVWFGKKRSAWPNIPLGLLDVKIATLRLADTVGHTNPASYGRYDSFERVVRQRRKLVRQYATWFLFAVCGFDLNSHDFFNASRESRRQLQGFCVDAHSPQSFTVSRREFAFAL